VSFGVNWCDTEQKKSSVTFAKPTAVYCYFGIVYKRHGIPIDRDQVELTNFIFHCTQLPYNNCIKRNSNVDCYWLFNGQKDGQTTMLPLQLQVSMHSATNKE
jgi:hypothetical protein